MTDQPTTNGNGNQPALRYERRPLTNLTLDPRNARAHDRANIDAIKESLQRFGQRLPVVVRQGQLVGGNATTIAADELGWTHLDVVVSDDLSEEEARRLAVMLNRSAELATWNAPVLVETLQGFDTLEGTGFDADALAELESLLDRPMEPSAGLTDPDHVPEPPAKPITQPGDLWLLGPHRSACTDARDATAVGQVLEGHQADLIWADPPYGVGYNSNAPKRGGHEWRDLANDDRVIAAEAFPILAPVLAAGGAAYVCTRWDVAGKWIAALEDTGLPIRNMIVWVKSLQGMGDLKGAYGSRWEGVLFAHRGDHHLRQGRRDDIWDIGHIFTQGYRYHPTEKPVALVAEALRHSSDPGAVVLDPFAGSGPTLIACHQTNRVACLMELDPQYVDVICRRFQEHTGIKPILEATGQPHDFTVPLG